MQFSLISPELPVQLLFIFLGLTSIFDTSNVWFVSQFVPGNISASFLEQLLSSSIVWNVLVIGYTLKELGHFPFWGFWAKSKALMFQSFVAKEHGWPGTLDGIVTRLFCFKHEIKHVSHLFVPLLQRILLFLSVPAQSLFSEHVEAHSACLPVTAS